MSCMNRSAMRNVTPSSTARIRYGTPRLVAWAMKPPSTDPVSIAAPRHDLCPGEDGFERAREAGRAQRIDEPRLGRAGEEREPQPEQDRSDRPAEEPGADLPHDQVQERRGEQRRGPEQEREAATAGVGHDPGRDLEQHLAQR